MDTTTTITRRCAVAVVLLVAGGTGCTRLSPGAIFGDVADLTTSRTGHAIHWSSGSDADRQIEARVHDLLAAELTADAAVQIALFSNAELQATYERLGIAQADLVQAGLLPNPVVHLGLRLPVNAPAASVEMSLVQDFIRTLQIPLQKRVAAAALESAKLEVAEAVVQLAADVKAAYYTVQGAEQMLDLRRSVVGATGYSAEIARRQFAAGNVTELDLANERALHEQARLELARAEADALAAREDLTALLGLWGEDAAWSVGARLPDLPVEEVPLGGLESLAVTQRLDLAAARQEIERLGRALGLTRFQALMPTGDLGADVEREPEGEWTVGPAIEVPLPLFDQGQGALASTAAQLRQAQARYRALAVRIRSEVRRAWTRMLSARRRAEHYPRVVLPLRRTILEQTQLQYNAMLAGVYQLLQAKQDEIEAGRSYVETLTEYWVARSDVERAVGGLLGAVRAGPAGPASPAPAASAPEPPPSAHDDHHEG